MLEVKFCGMFVGTTLIFFSLAAGCHPVIPQPVHSSHHPAQLFDDTIIIKYKEASFHSGNPMHRKAVMDDLAASLTAQHGVAAIRSFPILGAQQFRLQPGRSLDSVILSLRKHPQVQYAEYNFRILGSQNLPPPNDDNWVLGYSWGLTKIGMNNAWAYRTDARNIVVAVIDSGIDHEHLDLAPNMWEDSQSHGINACVPTNSSASHNPMDFNGHGTLVAGIIGAKGDNCFETPCPLTRGVGINWEIRLLAARALCEGDSETTPYGSVADAQQAIEYAIDQRADIINASWRLLPSVSQEDIQALLDAVKRTNCEGQNLPLACKPALFVAAAGNAEFGEERNSDNAAGKVYPANFAVSNIIAVAATTSNDTLLPDSHFGINSVPIAAPGESIESTFLSTQGDGFSALTGTSAAAPHVAGCAALLLAQSVASGSPRSIESLKEKLLNSADHIDALGSYIAEGKRLNCGKALSIASPPDNYLCIVSDLCEADEISVQFRAGTDSSRIKRLNELLGVEVVKTIADGQIVKIPAGKSREEIRRAYLTFPEVESVRFGK
jgi:subtilisin family serine protease